MMDELPGRLTFDRYEDFGIFGKGAVTDEKWADFWAYMCERYTDWAIANVEYVDEEEDDA